MSAAVTRWLAEGNNNLYFKIKLERQLESNAHSCFGNSIPSSQVKTLHCGFHDGEQVARNTKSSPLVVLTFQICSSLEIHRYKNPYLVKLVR